MQDRKMLPVVIASVLVGGALALVGAALLRNEAAPSSQEASDSKQEVAALRRKIDDLIESLPRRGSGESPGGERIPLIPGPNDTGGEGQEDVASQLLRMHEQLARILEIVMRLEENSPRSSLAEVSGALAARLPSDLQNKPRDVDAIHRMTGMKMSELTEAHVLWSYEKVVERYGSPTRIGPSSHPLGIRFYYETDSGEALMFHFIEGVVAGVIWD